MFTPIVPRRRVVGPVQQSRVLFRDDRTGIGEYRWFSYRAGEQRRSPTGPYPLIVIPWTAVRITQDGTEPLLADTSTVVFYNKLQPYVAEQLLDEQPERSIYIVPDARALSDCVREIDPASAENPDRPLRFTHGPCEVKAFINVRCLVERLIRARDQLDPLAIHEMLVEIIHETVSASYQLRGRDVQANKRENSEAAMRRHREAVMGVRELLVSHFDEPLGLPELAASVDASSYHLARIFRRLVGMSIHQYRTELRLRASLQHLCETQDQLATIALRMGFNSQSHFTTAFAKRFARTPAELRRAVRRFGQRRAQF